MLKLLNKANITILVEIVIASFILYFAAHTLFLKLFFPTRYTIHTLRIVLAIASGFTITIMLHGFLYQVRRQKAKSSYLTANSIAKIHSFASIAFAIIIVFILLFYPNFLQYYPRADYRIGGNAALYKFLQQQPKDSLIASLSEEAGNLPTFAKRAILVGREYALPFHLGYYNQIRQRTIDLIKAQYSPDLTAARELIQKYGVDFWLLETNSFQPSYLTSKSWLKSFQPAFDEALDSLQKKKNVAIAELTASCSILQTNSFTLLKTDCQQLKVKK